MTGYGRLFQTRAAATGKARSPVAGTRVRLTIDEEKELERSRWRASTSVTRARRANTGSVRLAIALQDLCPSVGSRSCPDTVNQVWTAEDSLTWTLSAASATFADVLVRRGSGYMYIFSLTYQPEFTVIWDPSCRRLSPPQYCVIFVQSGSSLFAVKWFEIGL